MAEQEKGGAEGAGRGKDSRTVSFEASGGAVGQVHLAPGTVVSKYRVESVLGEGGMGVVYLARQEKPDREVALKVVRAGCATDRALRRFEHESEVLGRLLHPGIAQIYEAGTADAGFGPQPFFAMELVKGPTLTAYAGAKKLGTRERLELLARVCEAVQHAHQKGVIHRDLKPGNILVGEDGQPKILDFGVARATESDIQSSTLRTDIGQLIGTIPYMSPEQVGGDPAELDTRSDVYALGVIAYELLAARLPYDLQRKMVHEAVRVIREEEPTPLSSVNRVFRGDVETIVAKALEKDKARRYQSATDLAADIGRYLRNEPIAARPASTWYQARKFARRNRALVGGVAAAFAALALGLAGTAYGLHEAQAQRDQAQLAGEREKEQRTIAETSEAQTRRVAEFQARMLEKVDPLDAGHRLFADLRARHAAALEKSSVPEAEWAGLKETFALELARLNATDTAASVLDSAVLAPALEVVPKEFGEQPLVEAALDQTLADAYRQIGLTEKAVGPQDRAAALRLEKLGPDHALTLASASRVALVHWDQGRLEEAEKVLRATLGRCEASVGGEDELTLAVMSRLGGVLAAAERTEEAERVNSEVLRRATPRLGPNAEIVIMTTVNQAMVEQRLGHREEAERLLRRAAEGSRITFGEDDPTTLKADNNLPSVLVELGRAGEAETLIRDQLARLEKTLGAEHPMTLLALSNLGGVLQIQGKKAEADRCNREALPRLRLVNGDDHPVTLTCRNNIGLSLQRDGKLDEAEEIIRDVLRRRRIVLGPDHADTIVSENCLAFVLRSQKRYDEAIQASAELVDHARRVFGPDHPVLITYRNNHAAILNAAGRTDEAIPLWLQVLESARAQLGENHPHTLNTTYSLGSVFISKGRFQEAEGLLVPGYQRAEEHLAATDPVRPLLLRTVVRLYEQWDQAEPGKGYDAKAAEWKVKLEAMQPSGGSKEKQ